MPKLPQGLRRLLSHSGRRSIGDNAIHGCVDEPRGEELRRGSRAEFSGWALDGLRAPADVEIVASRHQRIPVQLGVHRPDVPLHFGVPSASSECGWTAALDLASWPDPDVHIQIVVMGGGGKTACLMDRVFRVGDADESEGEVAADGDWSGLDHALAVLRDAGKASSHIRAASRDGKHRFSDHLDGFNREAPHVREGIAEFVAEAARRIPSGARVVDVGAGDAPYREFFEHTDYITIDWEHSIHGGAAGSDFLASAENLPLDEASADAIVMTEVLEHISAPERVLNEVGRILRPGGSLFLTVPFVWILHEMPHDFFRYTPSALTMLLERAGFVEVSVSNRGNYFTTLAQLMQMVPSWLVGGSNADGLDGRRRKAGAALAALAGAFSALSPLDDKALLPLGFNVAARRAPSTRV